MMHCGSSWTSSWHNHLPSSAFSSPKPFSGHKMDMLPECEGFQKRSIWHATFGIFVCDTCTWESANTQLPIRVRRTVTVREQQPISWFQRVVMQAFIPVLCRTSGMVAVCVEPLTEITLCTVYLPQTNLNVFSGKRQHLPLNTHTPTHTHNKHKDMYLTACFTQ